MVLSDRSIREAVQSGRIGNTESFDWRLEYVGDSLAGVVSSGAAAGYLYLFQVDICPGRVDAHVGDL